MIAFSFSIQASSCCLASSSNLFYSLILASSSSFYFSSKIRFCSASCLLCSISLSLLYSVSISYLFLNYAACNSASLVLCYSIYSSLSGSEWKTLIPSFIICARVICLLNLCRLISGPCCFHFLNDSCQISLLGSLHFLICPNEFFTIDHPQAFWKDIASSSVFNSNLFLTIVASG